MKSSIYFLVMFALTLGACTEHPYETDGHNQVDFQQPAVLDSDSSAIDATID